MNYKNLLLYEKFYPKILDLIFKINRLTGKKVIKISNTILCYHSVGIKNWRFSTSVNDFEKQIDWLRKKFEVVSLEKILKSQKKNNLVTITFDDGYEDIYQYAFPILKKRNMKATVFLIGKAKIARREELDNNFPLLTNFQINELYKAGWNIGFHTKTHNNLNKLDENKLEMEILKGKNEFEKQFGFNTDYFAYPRGFYSDKIINIVKKAGFKAAFSVDGGAVNLKNPYKISRVSIEGNLTLNQFQAICTPLGLKITYLLMQMLKIKESLL